MSCDPPFAPTAEVTRLANTRRKAHNYGRRHRNRGRHGRRARRQKTQENRQQPAADHDQGAVRARKAHYGICFAVVSGNAIKFQKFEFLDAVSHGKGIGMSKDNLDVNSLLKLYEVEKSPVPPPPVLIPGVSELPAQVEQVLNVCYPKHVNSQLVDYLTPLVSGANGNNL